MKSLIIDDSENVLILIRSNTHPSYANEEDLPGGEVETSENPIDAVMREIVEETGLEINQLESHQVLKKFINTNLCHILFICKVSGTEPEISLSWEHSAYKWVSGSEVKLLKSKDEFISSVNNWLISTKFFT